MEKKLNPLAQHRLGRRHLWTRPNIQRKHAQLSIFFLLLSSLGLTQSQASLTNATMCADRGGRWDSNSVQCQCVDEQGRVLPIGSPAPRTPNCAVRRSNAYYCDLIERELNGSGGLSGRIRRSANQIVRGRAATYSAQTGYCQCSPRVHDGELSPGLAQRVSSVCQAERY